ncbi:hypothetical protein VTP01DRAFT_124 [Rhizomucor pusillus]|uniref:uncharacterized protein n=1 Tax=Rhizomucor pusillus TaxID=4840 RepID=UPI003744536B
MIAAVTLQDLPTSVRPTLRTMDALIETGFIDRLLTLLIFEHVFCTLADTICSCHISTLWAVGCQRDLG